MIPPTIRSQTWRQFCLCFSQPDNELWEASLADGVFDCMAFNGNLLPHAIDLSNYQFSPGISLDNFAQAYSSCFEVGNAPVSFHGRTYSNEAASKIFEELFRFYEHFGLDLKDSENSNWPDSILMELDFMHYLSHLESLAKSDEDVASLQRAQLDFLNRHLIPLVTGISDKLYSLKIAPYDQLALLMFDYVNGDRDYLDRKVNSMPQVTTIE